MFRQILEFSCKSVFSVNRSGSLSPKSGSFDAGTRPRTRSRSPKPKENIEKSKDESEKSVTSIKQNTSEKINSKSRSESMKSDETDDESQKTIENLKRSSSVRSESILEDDLSMKLYKMLDNVNISGEEKDKRDKRSIKRTRSKSLFDLRYEQGT